MATVKGGKKCNLVQSWRWDWNTSNAFGKEVLLAQTFPINEDTHIASIFTNTFAPMDIPTYFCDIRATDGTGRPSGPNIATKLGFWIDEVRGAPGTWKMFFYDDFPLLTPGQYAIVMSAPTALTHLSGYLLGQTGQNRYRAGNAYISNDLGLTWEKLHYRCFLFEVWGWPPPPDAPPEPAISNWAATQLDTEYTETTVTLVVTTDKPVHLYMRWTLTKPLLHPSETYRRGLLIMAGTRFCFVSFHENEQEEAGDTLIHTFVKPDWPVCQTRWFYFIGQKQSIESPSASPIFHYHHVMPSTITYPSLWHNRDVYSYHGTWSTARDGISPTKWRTYQRPDNIIIVRSQLIATYHILRGYLNFHTQGMPAITAARLGLYVTLKTGLTGGFILTKGLWDEPVTPEDFGLQTDETTVLGQIDLPDIEVGKYSWIELNQAGLDWINQRPVEINQFESFDWRKSFVKGLYQPYHQAQSFTPQTIHTIKHIRIRARRNGLPGTLYIYIKEADANHSPTGPALATGSIDANTFSTAFYGDWYLVTLPTGLTIPADIEYCIEWHAPGSNTSNYIALPAVDAGEYPNGIRSLSADDGATWTPYPNDAIYFIEYEEAQVGGTKFCLRASRDVNNTPPTSAQTERIHFYSAQKGEGYLPILEVTT